MFMQCYPGPFRRGVCALARAHEQTARVPGCQCINTFENTATRGPVYWLLINTRSLITQPANTTHYTRVMTIDFPPWYIRAVENSLCHRPTEQQFSTLMVDIWLPFTPQVIISFTDVQVWVAHTTWATAKTSESGRLKSNRLHKVLPLLFNTVAYNCRAGTSCNFDISPHREPIPERVTKCANEMRPSYHVPPIRIETGEDQKLHTDKTEENTAVPTLTDAKLRGLTTEGKRIRDPQAGKRNVGTGGGLSYRGLFLLCFGARLVGWCPSGSPDRRPPPARCSRLEAPVRCSCMGTQPTRTAANR